MLFVIHWEVDFEKGEGKLQEVVQELGKEIQAHPGKYPRNVTEIYAYAGEPHGGFQVVEAETTEQLTRFALLNLPYVKCEVKPVAVEQTKIWFEYLK